jgi:uncharacterized protein YqgV (UPF0045/DUF77 family)
VSVDTGGGAAIGGNVDSGRDVAGRDHDDRSMNLVFAPTDASLRQPGVIYTLQEMFAAMERKLDEHGHQLQAIWQKVVTIEFEQAALKREFDEMKDGERAAHDKEEKRHQQMLLLWFRIITVVFLVIITSMLWWLMNHLGGI